MKKKHTIKMAPGDTTIVMPYSTLMYLAETCDMLAVDQVNEQDAQAWRDIADEIRFQSNENHYEIQEEEYWV